MKNYFKLCALLIIGMASSLMGMEVLKVQKSDGPCEGCQTYSETTVYTYSNRERVLVTRKVTEYPKGGGLSFGTTTEVYKNGLVSKQETGDTLPEYETRRILGELKYLYREQQEAKFNDLNVVR